MDDEQLAERFRGADDEAIRLLYRRFAGPVFTVAMSILHDRELAADAVQQTFLKAWRSAGTHQPGRPLAPWLYAIARRTAIDIYRKERRTIQPHSEVGLDAEVVALPFESVWEAWEVRKAVDSLPDDERDVVRLQHFEGLTHNQIADNLSVAIGTIKSRSFRAHRRLAESLVHMLEVRV